jgi:hypothetical protein
MKRYKYQMHHQWMQDLDIGVLTPTFIQEVTPGDTWSGRSFSVFRMAPLDAPSFVTLRLYQKFFFVPHRITFPEFEEVITGLDTTTSWPTITYAYGAGVTSDKWSKFGVGVMPTQTPDLNAMPVRAFNQVINDHFLNRTHYSERSLDSIDEYRVDFPHAGYYGGAMTEIQQGSEETVDTSGATLGVTAIRDAMNRQRMREKRSQYGERYRDLLMSYGVRTPDSRLDRAEYCAGARTTMGISEVVATATSTGENTGEYRGHGIAAMTTRFRPRYFTEHGTLIGVAYARPRLQLQYRVDKQFLIGDKDDLYHPELASDTMVSIDQKEVWSETASSTWAYTPKDEWLRTGRDTIAGNYQKAVGEEFIAPVEISSAPTVAYLQQVQEYTTLFQDQASTAIKIHGFHDHKIGKRSIVRPRPKR